MTEETMFQVYRLYESLYTAAARMDADATGDEIDREIERARRHGPAVTPQPDAPSPLSRAASWFRREWRSFSEALSGPTSARTFWPPEI